MGLVLAPYPCMLHCRGALVDKQEGNQWFGVLAAQRSHGFYRHQHLAGFTKDNKAAESPSSTFPFSNLSIHQCNQAAAAIDTQETCRTFPTLSEQAHDVRMNIHLRAPESLCLITLRWVCRLVTFTAAAGTPVNAAWSSLTFHLLSLSSILTMHLSPDGRAACVYLLTRMDGTFKWKHSLFSAPV